MKRHPGAVGTIALAILVGCGSPEETGDEAESSAALASGELEAAETEQKVELETIQRATERFRDVDVAREEGYVPDPMDLCVTAEDEGWPRQDGAMGIHFFRPDLLRITATEPRVAGEGTHTDFHEPSTLVYEPQEDGSLELIGVENLVFAEAWEKEGRDGPPTFLDNEYYFMADNPATGLDEGHMFEPHYDMHIWLFRDNPRGMFAQFNPNVSCEHHVPGAIVGEDAPSDAG